MEPEVTETFVEPYIRDVPHKYKRGPELIPVILDKNNEVLLTIRGKQYLISIMREPEPASAQTLKERLELGK
jgi:hypothetical protein